MLGEKRWKKARVRFKLCERESEIEEERVCVLGDSLGLLQKRRRWTACDDWRLSVEKKKGRERIERETEGEHVGDMKYVGSEMKACGWRDKCGIITEKSALSSTERHQLQQT